MKKFLGWLGLTVLAIVLPFAWGVLRGGGAAPAGAGIGLPWEIRVVDGHSEVFGLRPGESRLGEVRERLGDDLEVAIIARGGEAGAVEAYYSQIELGFVAARLILTLDLAPAEVETLKARAAKVEIMGSGARKFSLSAVDRTALDARIVKALGVIPAVNLDEATLVQRFGPAEEWLAVSPTRVHLLYASKGVDLIVDTEGKEFFQYVAPRDFALLRDPLRTMGDTAAKQ